MNQHVLPGNPPLQIHLRRSARARRMSLRVSKLDCKVTLTVPSQVAVSEALGFAKEKEAWLRAHSDARPASVTVGLGSEIPLNGQMVRVVSGQGRRISEAEGAISVPGKPETAGRRLAGYLRERAREELAVASDRYAELLGRSYSKLTIRDTRARWGSCTAGAGLMYSWRLILAPPEILNYVAAHEVAHLQEMNHSQDFWKLVEDLYGPYQSQRRWLQENGSDLHRYRFGD